VVLYFFRCGSERVTELYNGKSMLFNIIKRSTLISIPAAVNSKVINIAYVDMWKYLNTGIFILIGIILKHTRVHYLERIHVRYAYFV